MSGWFELKKTDKEKFHFVLKAGNAEIILSSEIYESKAAAEKGIASVQANSSQDERYEKKQAKDERFYFVLKAANHQIIGQSQFYKAEASCDKGIEAVKRAGSSDTIKDLTADNG